MPRSDAKTGQEKQVAFKTAFNIIKTYREQKNYLAAYVVTFSVIEDRVRALYVVWYRSRKNADPTTKKILGPFANLVLILQIENIIPENLASDLKGAAKQRNELLHAAMWNLDVFDEGSVIKGIGLARVLDSLLMKFKKSSALNSISLLN